MKKLSVILSLLLLAGCKTEIEKNISLNELLNTPVKTESAQLRVEVAGCQDHRDSRQPSQSLLQIQSKIPQVFKNANFKECYTSNFKSLAVFEIPVGLGAADANTKIENDINIMSNANNGDVLVILTRKSFRERLDKFKKSEPMLGDIELGITFYISNDLKTTQKINIASSYINDVPYMNATYEVKPNKVFKVKLSDVAADQLISLEGELGIVYLISQIKD